MVENYEEKDFLNLKSKQKMEKILREGKKNNALLFSFISSSSSSFLLL